LKPTAETWKVTEGLGDRLFAMSSYADRSKFRSSLMGILFFAT
jgi:hypothetical protein